MTLLQPVDGASPVPEGIDEQRCAECGMITLHRPMCITGILAKDAQTLDAAALVFEQWWQDKGGADSLRRLAATLRVKAASLR